MTFFAPRKAPKTPHATITVCASWFVLGCVLAPACIAAGAPAAARHEPVTVIADQDPALQPSVLLPRWPRPLPPQRAWVPGDRPANVAALASDFERLCDRVVAAARMPGLAAAMVKDGKVISVRGVGVRDVRTGAPTSADTVFRLASLSKAFASTTSGVLVERGELGWDDPIREFVPAFELADPNDTQRITLRDLLSHRTGLPANSLDRVVESGTGYDDVRRQLRGVRSLCPAGDCYAYQNVAFSAAGDIIYASTGTFYSEWVEKLLLQPLGMRTASLGLDAIEAAGDWAPPHVRRGNGFAALRPLPTYYRLAPAAGVNASARDMSAWLLAQLGHRPDVLPRALLDVTQAPQVRSPYELRSSQWRRMRMRDAWYGLGWRVVDYSGHRLVWHAGAVQGYRAFIALLPDHDFGFAVLWNSETGVPIGLMPTMLDRYLGLSSEDWLQLDQVERQARPAAPKSRTKSRSVVRPKARR